jgi:hypothetical protein
VPDTQPQLVVSKGYRLCTVVCQSAGADENTVRHAPRRTGTAEVDFDVDQRGVEEGLGLFDASIRSAPTGEARLPRSRFAVASLGSSLTSTRASATHFAP